MLTSPVRIPSMNTKVGKKGALHGRAQCTAFKAPDWQAHGLVSS